MKKMFQIITGPQRAIVERCSNTFKEILLVILLPVLVAVCVRKFFCDPVVQGVQKGSPEASFALPFLVYTFFFLGSLSGLAINKLYKDDA